MAATAVPTSAMESAAHAARVHPAAETAPHVHTATISAHRHATAEAAHVHPAISAHRGGAPVAAISAHPRSTHRAWMGPHHPVHHPGVAGHRRPARDPRTT